ncbi:MAG: YchJ family protein [Kangiellaceae bacterium]|nr:YchJ family protein [Kangiellaceae bacterium]MCW9000777.1 YchJ family protein [Kangiellaceae bacterium]
MTNSNNCACGSSFPYAKCCEPFHSKKTRPQTAEQLMRSRYCAFVKNKAEYIVNTHAAEFRQPNDLEAVQKTIDNTNWLGLKVVSTNGGLEDSDKGIVEFIAFYEESGIQQLHEESRFEKRDGQWLYLDGLQLGPIKIGRNDPCICNSGKKFKKCHG